MLKKALLIGVFISSFCLSASAQPGKRRWVDSVFTTMDLNAKIGQLFMIPVSSNKDAKYFVEIVNEIENHHIGGIIFTQGGPVRQADITNYLQNISSIPLLIGQDAGSGFGSTLDSTITFPKALALGAIKNDSLIYSMGKEIARQMKSLGVHINFAPEAGVMSNVDDVVDNSFFGTNRLNVTNKSLALMRGLQDNGVMACAKHFPLNGITVMSVHKGFPVVKSFADSVTVYPFQKLIDAGLKCIMPAAADFPVFYQHKNLIRKNKLSAHAMSSILTGEWLRNQMHYEGLLLVDIPQMQSPYNKYRSGVAEMLAFKTGNDILLSPKDIGPAFRKIKKLLKKEKQYYTQLDSTVRKILAAKYDAGLYAKRSIITKNLISMLNTPAAQLLNYKLNEKAITVIKNSKNILPVVTLEDKHFACLTTNETASKEFYHYLKKYITPSYFTVDDKTSMNDLLKSLQSQQDVIVSIFPQTPNDVIQKLIPVLQNLSGEHDIIICDFGQQGFIKYADDFETFISAYSNTPEMLALVPQVIFGALCAKGHLSFSATPNSSEGSGFETPSINRLGYSIPEDSQMDSETLTGIASIANEAINTGATPGCHVLVARKGKVVYEKSFGYLTYENKIPVTDETIYDLASVTKVSATLQAIMFLYEKGLIDVNKKASVYLPELRESNKRDFTLKDMLTHQAGLWPFLPFWAQTVKQSEFLPKYYSKTKSDQYPFHVAENLYAAASMRDSLWHWIIKSQVREKPARTPFDYKYSDMAFYILQHLSEKLLNQPLEDFIQQNLYEPLGSATTGYLPLQKFPATQIAPTEDDKLFRKTLLVGTVHDQGAAMQGGIAGHAGLFSNANDLAKLGQMLLQQGTYGGYRYYKPETIKTFTQRQFETSRRGLGWDKPIQSNSNSPTSLYASPKTFGHTGFTGTCIWVDPEFDLIYIFLSNRVHPDMTNNKLINENIRPRIQDVIYKSIFNYCQYEH